VQVTAGLVISVNTLGTVAEAEAARVAEQAIAAKQPTNRVNLRRPRPGQALSNINPSSLSLRRGALVAPQSHHIVKCRPRLVTVASNEPAGGSLCRGTNSR
jgi:hypothetical protein